MPFLKLYEGNFRTRQEKAYKFLQRGINHQELTSQISLNWYLILNVSLMGNGNAQDSGCYSDMILDQINALQMHYHKPPE